MNGDSNNQSKKRKNTSEYDEDIEPPLKKKQGRRKIEIEFIQNKSRRQITFSKRKAGILKKAYELTTLTGTQALLLITSETGHVYTFATPKLQPFITRQEGKLLIQRCLNNPDLPSQPSQEEVEPNAPPPYIESSLYLLVGKVIPTTSKFNMKNFKDLRNTTNSWAEQLQQPITCLVAGHSSNCIEMYHPDTELNTATVLVGLKVAEVDYTSASQPSFAVEFLRSYLTAGLESLVPDFFQEISNKPYVINKNRTNMSAVDEDRLNSIGDVVETPLEVYVVSTNPNAFVNVVFGVRKQGGGGAGSQVVGISCQTPNSHVCKLEVDPKSHQQRLQMTAGVEGVLLYHLLPELFK